MDLAAHFADSKQARIHILHATSLEQAHHMKEVAPDASLCPLAGPRLPSLWATTTGTDGRTDGSSCGGIDVLVPWMSERVSRRPFDCTDVVVGRKEGG